MDREYELHYSNRKTATLLDLVDHPIPAHVEGNSLAPFLPGAAFAGGPSCSSKAAAADAALAEARGFVWRALERLGGTRA